MPGKKHKLVAIFTDGEDFSTHLDLIKKRAVETGLHIITIGVGTQQGSPIPIFNNKGVQIGHQKDKKGKVVISRLSVSLLQNLADSVGGTYVQTTTDESDMIAVTSLVTSFEKERFEDQIHTQQIDRYPWFALISFLAFAFEWIL
jgi:Ca-activated chloride channel family protein